MLGKIEELRLISQCVLFDDRNAFGVLVEEYQVGIRRFLLNLTMGDVLLSEDLAQETFIKAYLNIRSFKGISKFKTWLYRIAYNEFYDWTRKRKEERLDETIQIDEPIDSVNSADAQIDVMNCMKSLNDTERSVVTLFYLDDCQLKKICEITGMPEGTVKSHLSRAKAKMAKVLKY
ncbi:MAG: RNA polymerase sigma factor [Muribaculaceae bacterium]|nr:RNA polymerase sigma factor [Muribaculaceae bacterium]